MTETRDEFVARGEMTIEALIEEAHRTALEKGWWDKGRARPIGEQFANFHAEISEAWEEYRKGTSISEVTTDEHGKPEGFTVELADVFIRIADTIGAYGLTDVFCLALQRKMLYNKTRPWRHGGKVA